MRRQTLFLAVLSAVGLAGCAYRPPGGLAAIRNFDAQAYSGVWYEAARFDHVFERGLTRCRATYTVQPNGGVKVLNEGYDPVKAAWRKAEGSARLVGEPSVGSLRVSFFWPFTAGYHVLDWNRTPPETALVCSDSRDYFWILSRDPVLAEDHYNRLVGQIAGYGFDTNRLIRVTQE